jgi:hypothetical protein
MLSAATHVLLTAFIGFIAIDRVQATTSVVPYLCDTRHASQRCANGGFAYIWRIHEIYQTDYDNYGAGELFVLQGAYC